MRLVLALAVMTALAGVPLGSAAATGDARPTRLVFSAIAAHERQPSLAPDRQIYSIDPAGSRLAQLTFGPGSASDPLPSPDGRWVAFLRGSQSNASSLWIMRADGGGQRRLAARGSSPAWSPDSSGLAYVHQGIRWVGVDGRGRRMLGRGAAPAWSPDGRSLAYLRGLGGLAVRTGGQEREIATWGWGILRATWSADGRWIAFETRDSVGVVPAEGGKLRTLGTGRLTTWSPKGARLAYARRDGLVVANVVAGTEQVIVPLDRRPMLALAWAPDGRTIAYVPWQSPQVAGRIVTVALGGRSPRILVTPAQLTGIFWSTAPGGARWRPPTPFAVVGGGELQLLETVDQLAADGHRVAYQSCGSIGVWRPAGGAVAIRSEMPRCGGWPPIHYSLALAGDRVAWGTLEGGNTKRGRLLVAPVAEDAPQTVVSAPRATTSGDPPRGNARSGYLLGDGTLLVFSTWSFCGEDGAIGRSCPYLPPPLRPIVAETLWRVPEGPSPGSCPIEDHAQPPSPSTVGRCQVLRREPGPLRPLDVDSGRVVVSGDNATLVLDEDGRVLASIPVPTLAAQLSGASLVVATRGRLAYYDASSAELLRTLPLPDLDVDGPCGGSRCPAAPVRLEDLARGLAVYVREGHVHLLRLRDGADVEVAKGTTARFGDHGLFYAYEAASPRRGRIRFVPFDRLPLA